VDRNGVPEDHPPLGAELFKNAVDDRPGGFLPRSWAAAGPAEGITPAQQVELAGEGNAGPPHPLIAGRFPNGDDIGLSPFRWTYSSQTALYALALVDVWQWTPLIMLIALAGLASLPREPYEAAHLDGASPRQAFWHITLPLLRPTLVVAILFRAIDALKTFDIIFVMTQGGPANATETINLLLFNQAFSYFNMGYASSMAVALFALVLGASLILIKVRRSTTW